MYKRQPLDLLEKGNEVAILDDSSLMGKTMEHPLQSRVDTGSSLTKDLGVFVLAFPYLKPIPTSLSVGGVLEMAFPHLKPAATTWLERGEGEHVRVGGRRAVAASSLMRDAWRGGAVPERRLPCHG